MASNTPPNPLPAPLVSLMETCSTGFRSTPLPHDSESDSESDNSAVDMCSVGSGDGQFSLVEGKSAKRKRKLAQTPPPASAAHQPSNHGNSGTQRVQREYPANTQTVSSPRIPPIVIPDNRNYTQLLRSISLALPSVKVEARCQGASLKLATATIPDFRSVQSFLTERKISFHTFALPSEREIKVVLSGIPSFTDTDAIRQELVALGYAPTAVSVLHVGKGEDRRPVNSFLVK